jgi:uncharacterized protein (DUF924 family)
VTDQKTYISPKDILDFWYSDMARPLWFAKDLLFDKKIHSQFYKVYTKAKEGSLDNWQNSPSSALALVITLDQFPRNMFRNTPQAFATDGQSLEICRKFIEKSADHHLDSDEQRLFLYMPFMHSENLADQEEGLKIFSRLSDNGSAHQYAVAHRNIIARFGRFPHRNTILGRTSTHEEIEFLKEPYSSF